MPDMMCFMCMPSVPVSLSPVYAIPMQPMTSTTSISCCTNAWTKSWGCASAEERGVCAGWAGPARKAAHPEVRPFNLQHRLWNAKEISSELWEEAATACHSAAIKVNRGFT